MAPEAQRRALIDQSCERRLTNLSLCGYGVLILSTTPSASIRRV